MLDSLTRRIPPRVRSFGVLLRTAWYEYERDYARYFAVAMVYYAVISIVPFLLLLFGILGLLLRFSDAAATLEQQLLALVDRTLGTPLSMTFEQILGRVEDQSTVATVVSLIGLLVTASKLFTQLRLTFRAIWKFAPPLISGGVIGSLRTAVVQKAFGYVTVVLAGVLLLAAHVLFASVQWVTGLFDAYPILDSAAGLLLATISPAIVVGLTFAMLFLVLPPVRLRWRHIRLATVLSTVAWVIGTESLLLFGSYIGHTKSAATAAGGLFALMLWINVLAQVLFYGAELCKVVYGQGAGEKWAEGRGQGAGDGGSAGHASGRPLPR